MFFPQAREPSASMQLDWTQGKMLEVAIAGQACLGLLCHAVLPNPKWQWTVPCLSESLLSLRRGARKKRSGLSACNLG